MRADGSVDDEKLHAYVDGHLDAAAAKRVEEHLAAEPAAAARVAAWRADTEDLRRAFAAEGLKPTRHGAARGGPLPRRHREPSHGALAAGLAATFLLGAGAGWFGRGSDVPHGLAALGQQAAVAQRVFASDPMPLDGHDGQAVLRVGLDAGDPGFSIKAPDLSAAGYALVGARLVPTEQGSAALFVYRNSDDQRLGVLVRRMIGIDTDAALRPVPALGSVGYAWSRDGVGFGLVSNQARVDLRGIAENMRHHMLEGS